MIIVRRRNVLGDIRIIINGIIILGFGSWIVRLFFSGVVASLITVMPLLISVFYIENRLGLKDILGERTSQILHIVCFFVAVVSILFSAQFVFHDYLIGNSLTVSSHPEHALAYQEIEALAHMIQEGKDIRKQISSGLRLEQYFYLYTYTALFFVVGGINVTNICIWNTFHLFLVGIISVLILEQTEEEYSFIIKKKFYMMISMPMFLAVFIYHRDIVAMAAIMLALYIYISTYANPIKNMIVFPIYAFLFYSARYQYIIIAFVLVIYSTFRPQVAEDREKKQIIIKFFSVILVIVSIIIILYQVSLSAVFIDDLHISNYTRGEYGTGGIIKRFILSVIGYFPWTNIFGHRDWTYLLFLNPQGWINTAFLVIIVRQLIEKRCKITNIFVMLYFIFYIFGFGGAVHVAYLAFAAPFAIFAMDKYSINKANCVIWVVSLFFILSGLIYDLLGLAGSGVINLVQ